MTVPPTTVLKPSGRPLYRDPQGLARLLRHEDEADVPSEWVTSNLLRWAPYRGMAYQLEKAASHEHNLHRALLLWERNAALEGVIQELGFKVGQSYSQEECRLPQERGKVTPALLQELVRTGVLKRSFKEGLVAYRHGPEKAKKSSWHDLPYRQSLSLRGGKNMVGFPKGPSYWEKAFPAGPPIFLHTDYAWYYNPRCNYRDMPYLLAAHSLWGVYALAGLTTFYETRQWPVHPGQALRQAHDYLLTVPREKVLAYSRKPFPYTYCYQKREE